MTDVEASQGHKLYLVMRLLGSDNIRIEDLFGRAYPIRLADEALVGYLPVFSDYSAALVMAAASGEHDHEALVLEIAPVVKELQST